MRLCAGAQMTGAESAGELPQLWAGAWDPHDPNRFITAGGNHIQVRAGRRAPASALCAPCGGRWG